MISIQQSVGNGGVNLIKDVRKIQTALVQTEFLKPTDYNKECLVQTLEQHIAILKNNILDWELERSVDLEHILEGNFKVEEAQLTATIAAINEFQKKYIPHILPDGKVDPNGRTIRQLAALSERVVTGLETSKASDIVIEGDKITISLRHDVYKTTKILSLSKIRNYIVGAYNWNGIIKMLQFAYENNNDKYLIPNQLNGTESDNLIIIPNQAIIYIIETQLKHSVAKWGLSQPNLSKILREVDGLPGNGFITKIIKAKSREVFYDESKNENQCRIEDDMNIDVPGLKADAEILYQFFRDMVRARNGLWSDVSGVINIVGFRRKIDAKNKTAYNDTIATCWLEADENGILKPNVEVNVASTEPGDRINSRQLVAQTITLVPGYHHLRQPGGRTRNAIKIGKNESGLVWEPGDTTMNFHQGSNNFTYPGGSNHQRKVWLSSHGFTSSHQLGLPTDGFSQQALHELNAAMAEIYLILSRYGLDGRTPAYQNLQKLAALSGVNNDGQANGNITISRILDGVQQGTRTIELQKAKNWFVNFWFKKRSTEDRNKCAIILKKLKILDDVKANKWYELSKAEILGLITDAHINEIVNTQIEYVSDWNSIDGLAGPSFYSCVSGVRQSITEAIADKARLDVLFDSLNDFTLRNVAGLVNKFKKKFFIKTDRNRERVLNLTSELPEFEADIIKNATVGDYSLGCQIIYDTEVFYTFWTNLLKRAQKVGQLRWYYTLIDATELTRSDLIA